ncbi:S8 family peptidase [Streptomyces sp. NPDC018955]|uniref:S8 family peptidase n=1 Tax=Streptomyces sp. NPDC018955 TaxID=3365055 RepID=UPI0037B045C0
MKRACAATIATATAVALAAGMAGPASAKGERTTAASATEASSLKAKHRITLITGDRVAVDAKGRVVGLERAEGREHIPVQVRRTGGHTLVVPADAARLIASGRLDQRLFDVTELNKATTRGSQKRGLKVIVGYKGAAASAKADVRDAGTVRRTLKSLNADAVQTPHEETPELWDAVTDGDRTASGIAHVWLDGVRKASLDTSVAQIGTPKAWAAGYDGKGVKIAVLDTGVDGTHPDLKGQVTESKNFTSAATAGDKVGHGTHVASIAAGTGAQSKGKYKGVAPGAKILNGKVLDDSGFGDDSGILAGMEWAAAQGADVVNMSLGGMDTAEVDPLEAAVNKLSAEKGVLFAIAAGNEGPQSVGSPGSADAALTVGAVDDKDALADFSSTGPRVGDGAVKPDVTAPGVDITAASAKGNDIAKEVGESPAGYMTISGTSMATPHVAGAAAILKQQHPEWTYTELKGALTGSTKGGAYTPFEQGSGRVQVDKAIKQTVIADPVSLSFGVQQWPHTDDKPVTKELTYRNLGTTDVTLKLTSTATGPKGKAAPAGFFKLGATTVTVPAGGRASVDLTVDTRLGGTLDGAYSAYVVATGGGQTVRTAAAVQREVESYDVTLKFLDRAGKPAPNYVANLSGISGLAANRWYQPYEADGTVTVRVPKGGYVLDTGVFVNPDPASEEYEGVDWLAQPKLNVTKDTTITLDARKAKPVRITVPDKAAKQGFASADYTVETKNSAHGFGWWLDSYDNFRSAHLGPQITDGSLYQQWDAHFGKGTKEQYSAVTGAKVKNLATGYTRNYKAGEFATVKVGMGAAASGKKGVVNAFGTLPESGGASSFGQAQNLPGTRTLHLSTVSGVKWDLDFEQQGGVDAEGWPIWEAGYVIGYAKGYKGGKTYKETVNTAVFGPSLTSDYGIFRDGNSISGLVPLFADGKGHPGSSVFTSATTSLYRNGKKVGSHDDPLFGEKEFKVPSADASYKLTTSVKRSAKVAAASTRIDASWTFRSKKTADLKQLPASTVRFQAATGLDSKVTAGKKVTVPVTVEGAAKGKNLKSLSVYVSYDYGKTWKKTTVTKGKITFKNPSKGKAVSFHAKIADKKGNKSTISIYNAYYGK